MIEKIKSAIIKNKIISDWKIREIEEDSKQYYFIKKDKECEKRVFDKKYLLTIYVDKEGKRGESTVTIQTEDDIEKKIESAIIDASMGLNPYYSLPEKTKYPEVKIKKTGDTEKFLDDFLNTMKEEKGVKLSAAELFQNYRKIRFLNSKGIDTFFDETSYYFEFVVIAKSGKNEAESHIEMKRRRLNDIKIKEIVPEVVKRAKDSLKTSLPKTGKFNVVISGEEVLSFFSPIIFHTSGNVHYKKESLIERGKEWIKECYYDRLTLIGNAILDYGNDSYPFDEDGVPNTRKVIIEDGIFKNIWSSKKYADYLSIKPTGDFGNIEIPKGKTPFKELIKDENPIYHIVEFSAGLWPDDYTGNFGGEIRLGYEIYKGKVKTIKGGSIRGNVFSCFSKTLFSKEEQFIGSYIGPKAIKFFDITIAGG
uniref:Metalloprotease TldD/E C-terminal domain-containing protein n=1 Tax=candidate division WOR-3 bacterium TaxID=2052148 RepID=A0A7C4U8W9_UNCW3